MEEENKVVEAEPVAEEKPAEQPQQQPAQQGEQDQNKYSLVTFILACVGVVVCWGWIIGGIAGIILGAMALKRVPNCKSEQNPYRVFNKISKPVAIVDIIAGIICTILYTIFFILWIVGAVVAAAAAATGA